MSVLPVTVVFAQFLAGLSQEAPTAPPDAIRLQSMTAWLPYYRTLQTVLGGNTVLAPPEKSACFSLFAQATLDGIAEMVRGFFGLPWTRAEFSHARLTTVFPHLCTAYQLTGATQDVWSRLHDLQERIGEQRRQDAGAAGVAPAPDTLPDLMIRIEAYLRALLPFLAQNIDHCDVLRLALPEPAPSDHVTRHVPPALVSTPVSWQQPATEAGHAAISSVGQWHVPAAHENASTGTRSTS